MVECILGALFLGAYPLMVTIPIIPHNPFLAMGGELEDFLLHYLVVRLT